MPAAIYHRVSTRDQDPALVREQLRRAAKAREITVGLEVEEIGSGRRNDRPGLQKIMTAVARGEVDCVLVWKLDRFGRSALDLLANIEAIVSAGATFFAVSQSIAIKPGADPLSKLQLTMLAGVAEFERALISERTLDGLAKARRRGRSLGRPAKADPERVAELRAAGMSWTDVASEIGCSASSARRAFARAAENGGQK